MSAVRLSTGELASPAPQHLQGGSGVPLEPLSRTPFQPRAFTVLGGSVLAVPQQAYIPQPHPRRLAIKRPAGHMLPTVGLGVYKSASGGECYASVLSALRLGYRHIDTAQICEQEAAADVLTCWGGGGPCGGRVLQPASSSP